MVADAVVQVYSSTGTKTPAVEGVSVEEVGQWLKGITEPRHLEPMEEVKYNSKLVDLASVDGQDSQHSHKGQSCLRRIRDTLEAMGFDPDEIVVREDTVDFNIHHPLLSPSISQDDQQRILPLYSIADIDGGVCWTWDPASCSTRGIVWHFNTNGRDEVRQILSKLSFLGSRYNHPLLLAILFLRIEINAMRKLLSNESSIIRDCQRKTGHHRYGIKASWSEAASRSDEDDTKLDLESMSKTTCGGAINITSSVLFLRRLVQLADFILTEIDSSYNHSRYLLTPGTSRTQQDADLSMIRQTESARRQAQGLLEEAEAWKHNSSIVVQTLLSLTTQRDQSISIKIARQATHDSTSMKAIATVTMCFLPGTFVSALFAVPFINWQTDPTKVLSPHFWVYWAVTVPLTCIVVVLWLTWTKRSLKKLPLDEEKAQRP